MASDIGEILKENILVFLKDNELNLTPTITSLLNEIKKEFTENKAYWSPPPVESLSCLYQLDHALAECRSNKRAFSFFSHLDPVERSNMNVLKEIKDKLIEMGKPNKVNANSAFILYTSCMYPTRKNTPKFPVFNKELEKIVNWIKSNDDGFKAIGIHGMCGTGKTTLAKMVLGDQSVRDKYKKPIWVCLYDLKSKDEMDIKIVKEMLAQLNEDPDLLTEEPEDNWLVEKLRDKLKAQKKYLVVLDGVWHCNEWFNDLLFSDQNDKTNKLLFSQALPKDTGGAVIVTSRQKEVTTKLVHGENLIHLKPWSDEKMKEFVKQCLEGQGDDHRSTVTIPQDKINYITYHCHGLPLVAVNLSGWLANRADHQEKV